ncbi:MAG: gpW family head-tail joining protein [Roseiarcus sp.]
MTDVVDPLTSDVLSARLAEAEAALHILMTTGGVTELRHGQKTMQYARADAPRLQAYIRDLRGQLGLPGARPRARRVSF